MTTHAHLDRSASASEGQGEGKGPGEGVLIVAGHVGVVIPSEEDPISHSKSLLYFEIIFKKEGFLLVLKIMF